jgi:cytochrome c oxidase subunit 2
MNTGNRAAVDGDRFVVRSSTTRLIARLALATGITVLMAFGAAACGPDAGSDSGPSLPPAAENGRRLAQSSGCAGCHGQNFEGGAGPALVGLAGSEVLLTDGTTVIADDAYLTTAITNPAKQLVDGYTLKMPANDLGDAEVADIVAFINTLTETP